MSDKEDKEFEELFENARDWPTAVTNLRRIIETDGAPSEPRLVLLKDTARETMLAILAHNDFEISGTQVWRHAGTEIKFGATPFLAFVFQKAFYCYRAELVPPGDLAETVAANEEFERAKKRISLAMGKLPPEMHRRFR